MDEATMSSITSKFEARRTEVTKDIVFNVELLANIKSLREVQINVLSLRQRLLEDNHTLLDHMTTLRKEYRSRRAIELDNISKNLQLRYQPTEKVIILDGKTTGTKHLIEIFENQIAFFVGSIKTVDNIIFAIKTRLDIDRALSL